MAHKQNLTKEDEKVREAYKLLQRVIQARQGRPENNPFSVVKSIPSRRSTRLRSPITRGSKGSYNIINLGGGRVATAGWRGVVSLIQMTASKNGFTRVATEKEESRLVRSSSNSNTTAR